MKEKDVEPIREENHIDDTALNQVSGGYEPISKPDNREKLDRFDLPKYPPKPIP